MDPTTTGRPLGETCRPEVGYSAGHRSVEDNEAGGATVAGALPPRGEEGAYVCTSVWLLNSTLLIVLYSFLFY